MINQFNCSVDQVSIFTEILKEVEQFFYISSHLYQNFRESLP